MMTLSAIVTHRCTEYRITDDISVWMIETERNFDYYIEPKGYEMRFSFAIPKKANKKTPTFNYEGLCGLYWDGYFDELITEITEE